MLAAENGLPGKVRDEGAHTLTQRRSRALAVARAHDSVILEITGFRGPGQALPGPPLYFSTGARVKRAMCARRGGEPGDEAKLWLLEFLLYSSYKSVKVVVHLPVSFCMCTRV